MNDAPPRMQGLEIWNAISGFTMKLICLSPSGVYPFRNNEGACGRLVTQDVQDYEFLDWKRQVNSAVTEHNFGGSQCLCGTARSSRRPAHI